MDLFNQDMDLLSQVEAIQIDNNERISKEDKEHCEYLQELCYRTLDQLQRSHEDMYAASKEYIDSEFLCVEYGEEYNLKKSEWHVSTSMEEKYRCKHYIPILQEKKIRNLFTETCHMFCNHVIDYFNNKYGITVECPDRFRGCIKLKDFDPTFRPKYDELVDIVIAHLGGRTFAQTMEDEVYAQALPKYLKDAVELKGNKITINYFIDSYYRDELSYDTISRLDMFIDALNYFYTGVKCVLKPKEFLKSIYDLRIGSAYECILPGVEQFKFYKNRKMEVKFKSSADAQKFHTKLTA